MLSEAVTICGGADHTLNPKSQWLRVSVQHGFSLQVDVPEGCGPGSTMSVAIATTPRTGVAGTAKAGSSLNPMKFETLQAT